MILRPFTAGDLEDVWAYQRKPAVARYMSWEARDGQQSQDSVDQMVRETGLDKESDCLSWLSSGPTSTESWAR